MSLIAGQVSADSEMVKDLRLDDDIIESRSWVDSKGGPKTVNFDQTYQSSGIGYRGCTYNTEYEKWHHDFQISTTAAVRGLDGFGNEEKVYSIDGHYFDIEGSGDLTFLRSTNSDYFGVYPSPGGTDIYGTAIRQMMQVVYGAVTNWTSIAIASQKIWKALANTNDARVDTGGIHMDKEYSSGWSLWNEKSGVAHYQRFIAQQQGPQESRVKVSTGVYGEKDTEVEFEAELWTDSLGDIYPSSTDIFKTSTLDPREMSRDEKDALGIKKVPTAQVKSGASPISSQTVEGVGDENVYVATNFPIQIDRIQ